MTQKILLRELKQAKTKAEKAALVAESVIEELPSNVVLAILRCGFLPWFSENMIQCFLGGGDNDAIDKIVNLPFVEKLLLGYCFHPSTREGLVQKYKKQNKELFLSAYYLAEKELLELSLSNSQALIYLLYGYVVTNQGVKAENLLADILNRGQADLFDGLSEINEAEKIYDDGASLTPKYWLYRAQLHLAIGSFDDVIIACDKALKIDNNYYQAYAARAVAYAYNKKFDIALIDANHAIKLNPDELSYRCRAAVYALNKGYKNAIFDLTRSIKIAPTGFLSYWDRARVFLLQDKPDKSLQDLEKAINSCQDSDIKSFIYREYANQLMLRKDWEKSLRFLTMSIEIKPTSGSFRQKGDVLFLLNQIRESDECFQQALLIDPKNPYAYLGRGKISLVNQNFQAAIIDFETAISLNKHKNVLVPKNSFDLDEAHLRLWETYVKLGDMEKAKEQKNILFQLTENDDRVYELMLFCRRYRLFYDLLDISIKNSKLDRTSSLVAGYASNSLGKYSEAIAYLCEVEKSLEVNINLSISYLCLGNIQKSKELFEEANLQISNQNRVNTNTPNHFSRAYAEQAFIMLMLGNPRGAIKKLNERLVDLSLDDLYDLRDWVDTIKKITSPKPQGLMEFSEMVNQSLARREKNSIYAIGEHYIS